jgi:CxxC motif-containing protein (DUF1111 family)
MRAGPRGSQDYGFVLSTSAISGFTPEARVSIRYDIRQASLADGTVVELHDPSYRIDNLSGPKLPPDTVLMPRMPPSVQGVGLLERVPKSELEQIALSQRTTTSDIRGGLSWVPGKVIGRFGWQATEPTVASQTAVAFAREMGLTNPLVSASDCGDWNTACLNAANGGSPEVAPDLFQAVIAFEQWHAVPVERVADSSSSGAQVFQATGCAECHRMSLRVDLGESAVIHPYTDLLLHEMGEGLADKDLSGAPVMGRWRTAPLWGMHAAYVTGQPLRLLHDGRARSIEEAILWHGGEAHGAREKYTRLRNETRLTLLRWIESL